MANVLLVATVGTHMRVRPRFQASMVQFWTIGSVLRTGLDKHYVRI